MALTCGDCGAKIELSDEYRRQFAGKFFACPECGASRKLPPPKAEPSPVNPFAFIAEELANSRTASHGSTHSKSPAQQSEPNEDAPHNEVLFKNCLLAMFALIAVVPAFFGLFSFFSSIVEILRRNNPPEYFLGALLMLVAFGFLSAIPGAFAYRIWRSLSGEFGLTFRHPANNFAVKLDDPFVMSMPFGPFYYAYHEAWMMFVITGLIVVFGFGIPWLILPWFAPHLMRRLYMKQGYRQTFGRDV